MLFKVITNPAPTVPKVLDTEFKTFYPTVNRSMDWPTLQPHIQQAEDLDIVPAIGQEFYDELNALYNGAGITDVVLAETFRLLRTALAYYAMYRAMPHIAIRIGDAGTMETTHDGATPVRQWTYNSARWECMKTASQYLDKALAHMEAQVADSNTDYDTWAESAAYTENRELLIPNARVFQHYYNISISRRAYQRLRPYIRKAQELYLRPVLCGELYDEITEQQAANMLSADNTALMPYLQRYLAEVAVSIAMPDLNFVNDGDGWRIIENTTAETLPQEALRSAMQTMATQAEQNAARYLQNLRDFLYSNLDMFPAYRDSPCNELRTTDPEGYYYPGEDYNQYNPPPPGAFIL